MQVANPLRLKTAKLDILSSTGDVNIKALVAVTAATVSAVTDNINIVADADFHANLISAPLGKASIDANGTLLIDVLKAKSVSLQTTGDLTLPDLQVGTDLTLGAGSLHAKITQVPSGPDPLNVTLTGYHGAVGTFADVTVDAPAGLTMQQLRFIDANIDTTARYVFIANAFMPGSLHLVSPLQTLLVNNRSQRPLPGGNVQLYQPGFAFNLLLQDYHTTSNAFVVRYDRSAQVTDILDGLPQDGASLIRDAVRTFRNGDLPLGEPTWVNEVEQDKPVVVVIEGNVIVINGIPYPIQKSTPGPAVNLGASL
jgi:hypothetical protein